MAADFLILLLLMALNGFFAMAELAVVSSRRVRLKHLAKAGSGGATAALRLIDNPTRFLSSVQIGITLIGVLAGVYSGAKFAEPLAAELLSIDWLAEHADVVAFAVVVVVVTYLSLIIGELVPKRWAMAHPERIAALVARPMEGVAWISAPLVWLLQHSTETLLRALGLQDARREAISEEEVRSLIADGAREGVFLHSEQQMIDGVLKLADRSARSVMVPRGDVLWLDPSDTTDAIWDAVTGSGHSRYLVCRGDLDEFIGVVQTRDLLAALRRGGPLQLAELARPPLVVQESASALKLLELLREASVHLAIVVDEHGSVEGIVTPTDILQAIAGDLPDLGSVESPEVVPRGADSWLIDGRVPIEEVERLLEREGLASGEDYTTLAGFALAQLGHLPKTGEQFTWQGLAFEIVDMDGRRIDKVLVTRLPGQDPQVDGDLDADG